MARSCPGLPLQQQRQVKVSARSQLSNIDSYISNASDWGARGGCSMFNFCYQQFFTSGILPIFGSSNGNFSRSHACAFHITYFPEGNNTTRPGSLDGDPFDIMSAFTQ